MPNHRQPNILLRAYRDKTAPKWQQFLIPLVVCFIATVLVLGTIKVARAADYSPDYIAAVDQADSYSLTDVCGVGGCTSSKINRPGNSIDFVQNFVNNDYGHTRGTIGYSGAFHDWWIAEQNRYYANHPNYQPCSGAGNFGCTWTRFTNHDTCIVGQMPDTFTPDSCTFHGANINWAGLLASPYWTKRGELYNKWVTNIVWCGTVGLIALKASGGSNTLAWLGSGSGVCLGDRVVP